MKKNKIIEILSWIGILLVLGAFLLNNLGMVSSKDILYCILNIIGGTFIGYDAYKSRNYQPVVLNIFWVLISIISIFKNIAL